jgi:ArsR family transcriptional regulator
MIKEVRTLKALADENRLRLLMLLARNELFVCQLMAVTGLSQPLVSHGLALLEREGFIASRRQGKRVFYRLKEDPPPLASVVIAHLAAAMSENEVFSRDRLNLDLFRRSFQRQGACDMETVRKFIEFNKKKPKKGAKNGKTGQERVR